MQTLTINNIETKMTKTGNTKVILVCQEGKFYFYRDTKNGPSKAQQQFEKFRFKLGDVVQAEVKTEQKTFTNDQGKEITFNDNWIQYFAEVEGNPVSGTNVPTKDENAATGQIMGFNEKVWERLENMSKWAKDIEKRVLGLETLSEGKALDLHQSFPVRDIRSASETPLDPEDAAKIVNSHKDDGIPVINQTPEGFDK